ncbi:MAG: TolC family protein [Burkholderiaceae bacterium]
MKSLHTLTLIAVAIALAGCATLSPDGNATDLHALTAGKTAGVAAQVAMADSAATRAAVAQLLAAPVTAESAVRIALLNNPGLHASMATLGISDADRVQAGSLPNPHLSLGRFVAGDAVEIERALRFSVIGLLSLPWRAKWQGQQHELAKLQAAQEVIKLAADTRRAWINAVAAQQTAQYMQDAKLAAEAGGELARRMARVGNWSRLDQAREQVFLADATTQLARAQQSAFAEREKLIRLLGLWGPQTEFTLVERLPDLPKAPQAIENIEERALRERLDVRSAMTESGYVANSLGLVKASGFINALDATYRRNTHFDNAAGTKDTTRGWELELPIPIFDWGHASNARAQGVYLQSVARVRQVAVNARSEAREAYHGYRTAYDVAVHYRDEVVPLRQFIQSEVLLRYNGMLLSVFDLLGDMRAQIMAVNSAIEAQRDFWLLDADLQTTLTGTSVGALSGMKASAGGASEAKAGH